MKRDLDHRLWKELRAAGLANRKILVALSGGVDSVALLVSLRKLLPAKNLAAVYIHHGPRGKAAQKSYRDRALMFCRKLCRDMEIPFFDFQVKPRASSEEELRDLRHAALKDCLRRENYDVLALAHHRDDLLETRLLRLIRGTGGQGLGAMAVQEGELFRPFLSFFKAELEEYLRAEKQKFIPDPSNKSPDPLRNWLRLHWLRPLEQKQRGAVVSLARSLETLAEESFSREQDLLKRNEAFSSQALSRAFYYSLSASEQSRLLAQYLLSLGKRDFSQSHLQEIRKRLDKVQNDLTFRVASCNWHINAEQIKVDL